VKFFQEIFTRQVFLLSDITSTSPQTQFASFSFRTCGKHKNMAFSSILYESKLQISLLDLKISSKTSSFLKEKRSTTINWCYHFLYISDWCCAMLSCLY